MKSRIYRQQRLKEEKLTARTTTTTATTTMGFCLLLLLTYSYDKFGFSYVFNFKSNHLNIFEMPDKRHVHVHPKVQERMQKIEREPSDLAWLVLYSFSIWNLQFPNPKCNWIESECNKETVKNAREMMSRCCACFKTEFQIVRTLALICYFVSFSPSIHR